MNPCQPFLQAACVSIALLIAACSAPPNGTPHEQAGTTTRPALNIFTDPDQPLSNDEERLPPDRQEEFAKSHEHWANIKSCGVYYILRDDGAYTPCYARSRGTIGNYEIDSTLYVWRDVRLARKEIPIPDHDTMITVLGRPSANYVLHEVEAPLQFVEVEKGKFVVGHLDFTFNVLYYFQGYLIPENALPPKGTQHRWPVVRSSPTETIWLVPIQVPAYLSDALREYKLKPGVSTPNTQKAPGREK